MTIVFQADRSNNLTSFIVKDQISIDEVMEVLKQFYELSNQPPTLNILWDIHDLDTITTLMDEDINRVVTYLSKHTQKRIGGKTAIVARAEIEYELSRRYEFFTQLKGLSVATRVFRTLGEAMIWIGDS